MPLPPPEGNKKVFSITEAGQAHLADNREMIDGVLEHLERFGRKMAKARDWFGWNDDGEEGGRRGGRGDVRKRATNSAPCATGCAPHSATSSMRRPKSRPRRSASSRPRPKRWKRCHAIDLSASRRLSPSVALARLIKDR